MTENDEWTDEELDRVNRLYEDRDPPGGLEDAVVDQLRAEGSLGGPAIRRSAPGSRRGPSPWMRSAGGIAAGLVLFFAGWYGRGLAPDGAPDEPPFILLLHAAPSAPAIGTAAEAALVDEYGRWMTDSSHPGRVLEGLRLSDRSELLPPTDASATSPDPGVVGFFTVSADDWEAALTVARGHPHRGTGGWIEVRRVAPVE